MKVGLYWGMTANDHIVVGCNFYENVKTLKYLGLLLTNQISIHEKIKFML